MKQLLKNARLIDPSCELDEISDILLDGDKIAAVGKGLSEKDAEVHDLEGKIVVPGLVDMHVHLRDPGLEYKEDIASGTRAAVQGGFSAVCCMPNTKPVIDNAVQVEYVTRRTDEIGVCRVHVAGALSQSLKGETLSEMGDMVSRGAVAFTDDGRGIQDAGMMRRVMDYASMFNRAVMCHCQDESLVGDGQVNEGVVSTRLGMLGWPPEGEELQIARDISLCRLTGCPLHIQHITTARGLSLVREAKKEGLPVTCEVTPHHLILCEDDITDQYDTNYKVNPPLRTKEDAAELIKGIQDGSIDCIVTDHAPHASWEKECEFEVAAFGMTGLETSLGLMISKFVEPGVIDYERLVELMAINPRKILRLDEVSLEEGSIADLTVIDPEATWVVDENDFRSKAKNSAFIGCDLQGRAYEVYVAGQIKLKEGKVIE